MSAPPKAAAPEKKKAKKVAAKDTKTARKFTIDCREPVNDEIFDIKHFEAFLLKKIKIDGKTGGLGKDVSITREDTAVHVYSKINLQKRYLKYLTKKYLKFHSLRDYIRVISNGKSSYNLKFYHDSAAK